MPPQNWIDKFRALLASPTWDEFLAEYQAAENQQAGFIHLIEAVFKWCNIISPVSANKIAPALIEIITELNSTSVSQRALGFLLLIAQRDFYSHDVICKKWFDTRHPALTAIIQERECGNNISNEVRIYVGLKKGQIYTLDHGGLLRSFEIIDEACTDTDPEIAERAQVVRETWIAGMENYWLETRQGLHIIKQHMAEIPISIQTILILESPDWESLTEAEPDQVKTLLWVSRTADAGRLADIRYILENLSKPAAQQALCRAITEGDYPIGEVCAVVADYRPVGLSAYQQALYYFLTEQWDRYEIVDFDHRLLQLAYQTGESGLRYRLLTRVRMSGRPAFLEIFKEYQLPQEVNQAEAELMTEMLAENRQWERLWQLVLQLPVSGSRIALHGLIRGGWRSKQPHTQTLYDQLRKIAAQPMLTGPHKSGDSSHWPAWVYQLPIARLELPRLDEITVLLDDPDLWPEQFSTLRYLQAILTHRHRHAIELGEPADLPVADFDIEIE